MFPVASGGLAPTMIPDLYSIFGKEVIMQFGGGIHAHLWVRLPGPLPAAGT
jgi:ribulose-bisphosphate carboxylase large chain